MIKCGIIGCGVIAPTHIAGIEAIANAELAALCDIDSQRLNTLGDKHNISKRYTDYRDMLADKEIDLVHVCTDHASHCQIVIDALNAGKHVICEKSSGRVDADLEAMAAAAKAHPELVSSGIFQHRFFYIMERSSDSRSVKKIFFHGTQLKFAFGEKWNFIFC